MQGESQKINRIREEFVQFNHETAIYLCKKASFPDCRTPPSLDTDERRSYQERNGTYSGNEMKGCVKPLPHKRRNFTPE